MRTNRKLLSGIALIVVAVLIVLVWRTMTPAPTKVAETPPGNGTPAPAAPASGQLVARATDNIPQGTAIGPGMYRLVADPNSAEVGSALPTSLVNDAITSDIIPAGQVINKTDISGHLSDSGVAGLIRPGYRAIIIPITAKPALHDLVHIGNYVDIYAAFDNVEARSVVQNVRVLAVDDSVQDFPSVSAGMRGAYKADYKGGVPPDVISAAPLPPGAQPVPTPVPTQGPAPAPPSQALTLEVVPQDAAKLMLVENSGAAFDFILRPPVPVLPPTGQAVTAEPVDLPVSATKAQIAPYSTALKNPPVSRGSSGGFSQPHYAMPQPTFPPLSTTSIGTSSLQPMVVATPEPSTYDIPVYADGKLERTETVPRPNDQE